MKHNKWIAFAAVAILLCGVHPVGAVRFNVKELKWQTANLTNIVGNFGSAAGTVHADTLFADIAVGETDTSEAFDTHGLAIPTGAAADSVPFAWLTLVQDSSTAVSPAMTSATVNVDLGFGQENLGGYTTVGSVTLTDFNANDKVVRIPLYINLGSTRGAPGTTGHIAPRMRLRIASASGGSFPAARLFLIGFADTPVGQ